MNHMKRGKPRCGTPVTSVFVNNVVNKALLLEEICPSMCFSSMQQMPAHDT
jgi:hypothetical protein